MEFITEDLPQTDQPADSPAGSTQTDTVQHLLIANRFNIDSPSKEESGKLAEIWDHAKSLSKTGDLQDVIWQVVHLEQVLGAPRLGESRLDRLYRYAKLKRQESYVQEELKRV